MRSETRLDSAIFQLTPTRTRCDLVIIANGEREKMASGLLKPFLAHLKTAQDQIERGGYSIVLEPNPENKDVTHWFTRGTVERFVRFVSTPEILERVNTIESEIVQIDEAILIQGNTNLGLSTVAEHQMKPPENNEAYRYFPDTEAENAIVLYKMESSESATQEEQPKVKLLRVLETRKAVLQKEQGMAFARAVAAGFDMDHIDDLISFADCFGASRLREACLRFMELWKRNHDTAQWLEGIQMQATKAVACQPDPTVSWPVTHNDGCFENSVRTQTEANLPSDFQHVTDPRKGKSPSADQQGSLGQNNHLQGQFQHPMFMQWTGHSPQGPPLFPAYPLTGIPGPYYLNCPGNGQFFQQPYAQTENPDFTLSGRAIHRRHSTDGRYGDVGSEYFSDQNAHSEIDREEPHSHESRRNVGRASKKGSGMVVIRNINYITSPRNNSGAGESQSDSGSEIEEAVQELAGIFEKRKHKGFGKSSREPKHPHPDEEFGLSYERDVCKGTDADNEHWKAFQDFLLSKDEDGVNKCTLPLSSTTIVRRGAAENAADTHLPDRSPGANTNQRMTDHDISNSGLSMGGKRGQNDESINGLSCNREIRDHQNLQFSETGGFEYSKRMSNDDFRMYGHQTLASAVDSRLRPISGDEFWTSGFADKSSARDPNDDSFIVPVRSSSHTLANGRTPIEMDSEFSSEIKNMDNSNNHKAGIGYEPDNLSMIPERQKQKSCGITADYEMQVQADMYFRSKTVTLPEKIRDKSKPVSGQKKKDVGKDRKQKTVDDSMEKRKVNPVRSAKVAKSSPLAEAQARAERLRAYKADLQKEKMEQEKEKIKRLEALKREREKRISARSNFMKSASSSQQTNSRSSTKLSPGLLKSSKFTDSEGGSLSPITKISIRSSSVAPVSSLKASKLGTLSGGHVQHGLTQSAPSLHKYKKMSGDGVPEISVGTSAAANRLRRLSEPKNFNSLLSDGKTAPKPRETTPQRRSKVSPNINKNGTTATTSNQRIKARSSPGRIQDRVNSKEIISRASESQVSLSSRQKNNNNIPRLGQIKVKDRVPGALERQASLSSLQKKINGKSSKLGQIQDAVVIDKKVLTIEREIPPVPIVLASEKSKELRTRSFDGDATKEKAEVASKCAAVRLPPSNVVTDIATESNTKQVADSVVKVASSFPRLTINEQPYRAPHARKSSMEDLPVVQSGYVKPLPSISEPSVPIRSFKANTLQPSSSSSSKQTLGESERSPGKGSKGLKRFLKLGRKNDGSPSSEKDTDRHNVDVVPDSPANPSSGYEAHSLKNLISQDDSYSEMSAAHKAHRSFSLLSPFRSKKRG